SGSPYRSSHSCASMRPNLLLSMSLRAGEAGAARLGTPRHDSHSLGCGGPVEPPGGRRTTNGVPMVQGQGGEQGSYVEPGGAFNRDENYISDRITADGGAQWPVEAGR